MAHKEAQLCNMPFNNFEKSMRILQWLSLHMHVSSLPGDSSEAFQATRQICVWSPADCNLAFCHIRIPNCAICHSTILKKVWEFYSGYLTNVCFVAAKGLIRGHSANSWNMRLKSRWHQNDTRLQSICMALRHIRIPNCAICHSTTWEKHVNFTMDTLHMYVLSLPRELKWDNK